MSQKNPDMPFAALAAAQTDAEREYEATHAFRGFRLTELRRAFGEVCDKADWRKPWTAFVRRADLAKVRAAALYFHADEVRAATGESPGRPGMVEVSGAGLQQRA